MIVINSVNKPDLEKAGFRALLVTLFLLSFPRSWSLYSLGFMMVAGFGLWLKEFRYYWIKLKEAWIFILPPVAYFLLNLVYAIIQGAGISVFESRFLFLAVPLLGFPVFCSDYLKSRLSYLTSGFTLGITLISCFLLTHAALFVFVNYDGNAPLLAWMKEQQQQLTSIGFSFLEHPTYLALKINWVFILLVFSDHVRVTLKRYSSYILALLSLTIILLASKAGLFLWFILVLIALLKEIRRSGRPFIYFILLAAFVLITAISVMKIQRIEKFLTEIKSYIETEGSEWKDINQRTREWYVAIQIIKDKPIFGAGISKVEALMVEKYLQNDFKDEAALRLNAHNQFLEAQMTFGITGTITLFFMLLAPLFHRKEIFYFQMTLFFVIVITYFLSIESMFNRQWGIMFFLLFYNILLLNKGNTISLESA